MFEDAGPASEDAGPRPNQRGWLMAVIVICLAPVMDPIAADITVTALAVWAMASSRR